MFGRIERLLQRAHAVTRQPNLEPAYISAMTKWQKYWPREKDTVKFQEYIFATLLDPRVKKDAFRDTFVWKENQIIPIMRQFEREFNKYQGRFGIPENTYATQQESQDAVTLLLNSLPGEVAGSSGEIEPYFLRSREVGNIDILAY